MNLPGRLRTSTLGDILGTLHRGRVSGVLALREVSGATAGRVHRIYLRAGLVISIETVKPGGERARELLPMSRDEVKERIDALFKLDDADVTFHVASARLEAEQGPLVPSEFLHGRPRARDRRAKRPKGPTLFPSGNSDTEAPPVSEPPLATVRRRALATLGLPQDASALDVQKAFKRLALRVHPDRHPDADARQREELSAHFARLTQAYHLLMA